MEQTLLDEQEIVKLLADTLEEEKQTDLKLTAVAEQHTMAEAMSGGIGVDFLEAAVRRFYDREPKIRSLA
jgi:hypothetical protein